MSSPRYVHQYFDTFLFLPEVGRWQRQTILDIIDCQQFKSVLKLYGEEASDKYYQITAFDDDQARMDNTVENIINGLKQAV